MVSEEMQYSPMLALCEKYEYVIVSTLAVAIIVGLITPEPGIFIRKFSAPLIVIMIGAMGFTIAFKSLGT